MPAVPRTLGAVDRQAADYQMQLRLLEEQNKRRLWLAGQSQDAAGH